MSTNVRFFVKATKDDAPRGYDYFIRDDGSVWRDNYRTYESQCAVVGFENFIMPCPEIGWEITSPVELIEALKDAHPHIADDYLRARIGNLITKATGGQQ